jgi:heme/copper-type cytochrome/quinol oxidase subunit 2
MKFLLLISNAFINTMGITQPSPKAANRAAWIIFLMLVAVLAGLIAVVIFGLHFASGH